MEGKKNCLFVLSGFCWPMICEYIRWLCLCGLKFVSGNKFLLDHQNIIVLTVLNTYRSFFLVENTTWIRVWMLILVHSIINPKVIKIQNQTNDLYLDDTFQWQISSPYVTTDIGHGRCPTDRNDVDNDDDDDPRSSIIIHDHHHHQMFLIAHIQTHIHTPCLNFVGSDARNLVLEFFLLDISTFFLQL